MATEVRKPPYLTDDPSYWRRFGIEGNCAPDTSHLEVEDFEPVESFYFDKQYHILTDALYTLYKPPGGNPFVTASDVGVFYEFKKPPLVPDVFLSNDIPEEALNVLEPNFRSYFAWMIGKMPDVVVEIVSDRRAREDIFKKATYQSLGVPYFVIFDPHGRLKGETLATYELHRGKYRPCEGDWFPKVQLGMTLWYGTYQGMEVSWLHWCDRNGTLLPVGTEVAEQAKKKVSRAKKKLGEADDEIRRLKEKLKALGIDPEK